MAAYVTSSFTEPRRRDGTEEGYGVMLRCRWPSRSPRELNFDSAAESGPNLNAGELAVPGASWSRLVHGDFASAVHDVCSTPDRDLSRSPGNKQAPPREQLSQRWSIIRF